MAVAKLLCRKKRRGGDLKWIADLLEVSPRTIQNWLKDYKEGRAAKEGRPSYTETQKMEARELVSKEMTKQGATSGWRPIDKALENIPTRLIQRCVKEFKQEKRKHNYLEREKNKKSIEVIFKNVYWTQDGTHLGRIGKEAVESQIMKDRGSLKLIGIQTGKAATADSIITFFEAAKKERGLPLVLGTDNGSSYCNEKVECYLEKEKVIHFKSLPRTPEHNGSAEIGMREIKKEAMLGKGVVLERTITPHALLIGATEKVNSWLRGSKRFKSANELDDMLIDGRDIIDRNAFYRECESELRLLREEQNSGRALRMKEREVIVSVLEKYGAIKQTRGDGIYGAKCEVFL